MRKEEKMKEKHRMMWLCLFIFSACCGLFSGCGNQIQVTIEDGNVNTVLQVKQKSTVREALKEADIAIYDQDVVSPDLDMQLYAQDSQILITRHVNVTIHENGKKKEIQTNGGTVSDVLKMSHIVLQKRDYVNHTMEAPLTDQMDIVVEHRHKICLLADGQKKSLLTKADTVSDFLEEQNIHLDKKDKISPKLSQKITDDMKIVVQRVQVKKVCKMEQIAYDTKVEYSSAMYKDQTKEKKAGINGKRKVWYQETYVDGKIEKKHKIKEKTVKEPEARIVVKGTKTRQKATSDSSGRRIISKEKVYDCDGSGHGYYIIKYSDGKTVYKDF